MCVGAAVSLSLLAIRLFRADSGAHAAGAKKSRSTALARLGCRSSLVFGALFTSPTAKKVKPKKPNLSGMNRRGVLVFVFLFFVFVQSRSFSCGLFSSLFFCFFLFLFFFFQPFFFFFFFFFFFLFTFFYFFISNSFLFFFFFTFFTFFHIPNIVSNLSSLLFPSDLPALLRHARCAKKSL